MYTGFVYFVCNECNCGAWFRVWLHFMQTKESYFCECVRGNGLRSLPQVIIVLILQVFEAIVMAG